MKHQKSILGELGEKFIVDLLQKQGFFILATNFNAVVGELDIVAKKDKTVVFVEVKTRDFQTFISTEIINKSKQRKVIAAAKKFILVNNLSYFDYIFRFDVAIVLKKGNILILHSYLENAYRE